MVFFSQGALLHVHKGFFVRNSEVAKCHLLIAFSWAAGSLPTEGGTLDTWEKSSAQKFHISLKEL